MSLQHLPPEGLPSYLSDGLKLVIVHAGSRSSVGPLLSQLDEAQEKYPRVEFAQCESLYIHQNWLALNLRIVPAVLVFDTGKEMLRLYKSDASLEPLWLLLELYSGPLFL